MSIRRLFRFMPAAGITLISLAFDGYGSTVAGNVSVRPGRFVSGDSAPKEVTLTADISGGDTVHLRVDFRSSLNTPTIPFIERQALRDGGAEDQEPQPGKIRILLARRFEQVGIYHIRLEEAAEIVTVVHEATTSRWSRFVDYFLGAAGGGTRSENDPTARLDDQLVGTAIWTAPVPKSTQKFDTTNLRRRIRSAMMPAWSPNAKLLACSAWHRGRWMVTAFEFGDSIELPMRWRWPATDSAGDTSPVWSPDGRSIAFIRRTSAGKSDIWTLSLNAQHRPLSEMRITELGGVQQIIAWNNAMGILFETIRETRGVSKVREMWSIQIGAGGGPKTISSTTPRAEAYKRFRGWVADRNSLIFDEQDVLPRSVIKEITDDGNVRILLIGEDCFYKWPAVSPDGRWFAVDSNCSQ